ncbi:MAG: hydrogenase expression/formation protein HypE [Halobacteriota archaeon]|nr:hydrogenase expression/formation protein HypE [Halobacteriota archaeon]
MKKNHITLAHGAGGEVMQGLIKDLILNQFDFGNFGSDIEIPLSSLDDSSVVSDIVFTIDSHTVKPLFFPGGDIGSLSVSGTVNDISVMGADPIALSSAFIIEEGFLVEDLERILKSMKKCCEKAEVPIITGDTKVVEGGGIEGMLVTTSAIGLRSELLEDNIREVERYREFGERWIRDSNLRRGDMVIVSGTVGDHGVSLLSFREGYGFESEVESDVAPLNKMIAEALKVGGVTVMKDPTRGGLSNTLNEISEKSGVGIMIEEENVPLRKPVISACEMLGLDPLEIGNEGKVVMGVIKEKADEVLEVVKATEEGRDARIIGVATGDVNGVVMKTRVGGKRIIETPVGDPVPRIC